MIPMDIMRTNRKQMGGHFKKWDACCSFQKMKLSRGAGVPSFDNLPECIVM
jgi:hypothetical protein